MKNNQNKALFFFVVLMLFSGANLFSQTRGLRYSKQINTLDILIGGDFGYRIISGDVANTENPQEVINRELLETFKLNYRFGLNYYLGVSSRLLIKTGLRFTNPGFSTNLINQIDPTQDINAVKKSSYSESTSSQGFEYRYKYQFIEVPLGVKYVLTNSKCKAFLEFTLSPNFYWKTIVEERFHGTETSQVSETEINENIKKVNFIASLSAGGDFAIGKRVSGFSQIVARYQINNLRNGILKEKILGIGLELGIRYHL